MDKKRAFQKVIAEIRKDWRIARGTPNGEFPKAMMTGKQMEKNTGTVNCGGEWCSFSRSLAHYVMNDNRFKKFLIDYNASAEFESFYHFSTKAWQIRIHFKEEA